MLIYMKKTVILFVAIIALLVLVLLVFFLYIGPDPILIDPADTLEDVTIQPAEALKLAEPYMKAHGTYVWKEDTALRRTILRQKDWYFINDTNYPAKTIRYYMQPAVKVHVHTGEVEFSKK